MSQLTGKDDEKEMKKRKMKIFCTYFGYVMSMSRRRKPK